MARSIGFSPRAPDLPIDVSVSICTGSVFTCTCSRSTLIRNRKRIDRRQSGIKGSRSSPQMQLQRPQDARRLTQHAKTAKLPQRSSRSCSRKRSLRCRFGDSPQMRDARSRAPHPCAAELRQAALPVHDTIITMLVREPQRLDLITPISIREVS
ncbi:hypothetical protein CCHR01_13476 [Colletotrichum chrysophilum]|uniref:Uncharacterized protein n=1 Tax=Colletotrichum chrysophilum TaxID=1836956 RepID=A0AAD9A9A7_9PEZI|nr:hypothetical protein CCHR01_13476 [Colletotrichum chrysophilum]